MSSNLAPIDWIEQNFYLYDTQNLITLYDCQRRPLELAFQRDPDGGFHYRTILWSWPKKSAKSSVIAAVADYTAAHIQRGSIKLIANDLKQADSRVGYYLRENLQIGRRAGVRITPSGYKIDYPNGSRVECLPIDPSGEAGGNDDLIVYSELWGWKSKAHQRMWSEMTLSPTKYGRAQRWIDTYAGFYGESPILEQLYETGVTKGVRVWDDLEVYVNETARLMAVWVTKPMFPWQTADYYAEEAANLTPDEFERMHHNRWASPTEAFLPIEWWDGCRVPSLAGLRVKQGVVIALDAAVDHDCFAIIMLSVRRDETGVVIPQVRYARAWTPPKGGKLLFSNPHNPDDPETPEGEVRRLCRENGVVCVAYDPMQLEDMAGRLGRAGVAYFEPFSQGTPRAIADKRLYDIIRDRRIEHTGEADLRQHIQNSNRKPEDKHLRIIKRSAQLPIDLTVALSMAVDRSLFYNL